MELQGIGFVVAFAFEVWDLNFGGNSASLLKQEAHVDGWKSMLGRKPSPTGLFF